MEQKNKKIVFFDIDGTIYMYNKGVPNDTKQAISMLKSNGHIPILCTGRTRAMIPQEVLQLGFDGIIGGAGTYLELNNTVQIKYCLEKNLIQNIIKEMFICNISPIVEGIYNVYFSKNIEDIGYHKAREIFSRDLGEKAKYIEESKEIIASKISGHLNLNSNLNKLKIKFENQFNFVNHGGELIEMIPKPYSKAVGIERMLKLKKISIEDTYAFGDSMNDFEMLKYVKYPVAMGNSDKMLKQEIEYVTSNYDDGGVFLALSKFGLI